MNLKLEHERDHLESRQFIEKHCSDKKWQFVKQKTIYNEIINMDHHKYVLIDFKLT